MSNTEQEKKLVSVIVPVYGVERYIGRCVRAIMNQDYENLEIILVDDGTKDGSGEIIDALASEDSRIVALHQENAGVSSARNTGLKRATGEYILFVDGDDYVDPDYVSYFVDIAETQNVRMVVNTENYSVDRREQVENQSVEIWRDTKVIEAIYLGDIFVAVWNKLYKREVLEKYHIQFNSEIWYGEGMLFNTEYLQQVETVAVGNRRVYHQVYNPGSAMRKFNLKSNLCGMYSMDLQKKAWEKITPGIEMAWKYHYRNFSQSIIAGLISINAVKENKEIYKQCMKNIRKDMLLPWQVNIPLRLKLRITLFSIAPRLISCRRARKAKRLAKREVYKTWE